MYKTRNKDTALRKAIRHYTDLRIHQAGDPLVRITLQELGVFMLLRGICSGEVQAHEQTGLVMNHLVQEGEYKYGDMGEDTVIKLTLDQECEEYNAKLANAKSNHGVINYYTVRGLPVPE